MTQFRGFFIPDLSATMNVAWETVRSLWPENSPCMELIRGRSGGNQFDQEGNYHQAEGVVDGAEMTTMNGDGSVGTSNDQKRVAEESFSYQRSG